MISMAGRPDQDLMATRDRCHEGDFQNLSFHGDLSALR